MAVLSMRSACDGENPTLPSPANSRALRYGASVTSVLCLVFACRREKSGAQSTDEEYRVKAAFLFHFAQLVDWPPETGRTQRIRYFYALSERTHFRARWKVRWRARRSAIGSFAFVT